MRAQRVRSEGSAQEKKKRERRTGRDPKKEEEEEEEVKVEVEAEVEVEVEVEVRGRGHCSHDWLSHAGMGTLPMVGRPHRLRQRGAVDRVSVRVLRRRVTAGRSLSHRRPPLRPRSSRDCAELVWLVGGLVGGSWVVIERKEHAAKTLFCMSVVKDVVERGRCELHTQKPTTKKKRRKHKDEQEEEKQKQKKEERNEANREKREKHQRDNNLQARGRS